MSLTVCKFGGSSVSDAGMFVRVNRIVHSEPSRKYIVLSAPGKRCPTDEKITDLLFRAHEALQLGDASILPRIFKRYAAIRDALCPEFDLEGEFAGLRLKLHSSLDYAASRGEYLCAKLFAAYTKLPFVDAADLMFFAANGSIDFAKTRNAVQKRLLPLGSAIVPGYYGTDAGGAIRTFSRGGSDVSGALLSAAMDADVYENWTDVDGLYTADPAIVPDACRTPEVSFAQMERIAAAGAKLLHPDALLPLRNTGIDVILKNTFSSGLAGTRISESSTAKIRCVTGQRELYMLGDPANEGSTPLLHACPAQGCVPVSAVRVFGLEENAVSEIRGLLSPIHIIHMQDHIQIIVPVQEYETTIRRVHDYMKQ